MKTFFRAIASVVLCAAMNICPAHGATLIETSVIGTAHLTDGAGIFGTASTSSADIAVRIDFIIDPGLIVYGDPGPGVYYVGAVYGPVTPINAVITIGNVSRILDGSGGWILSAQGSTTAVPPAAYLPPELHYSVSTENAEGPITRSTVFLSLAGTSLVRVGPPCLLFVDDACGNLNGATTKIVSAGFERKDPDSGAVSVTYLDMFDVRIEVTSLDGVLPSVPEPASWMMVIVGFGAMGCAMRQRRQPMQNLAPAIR